MLSSELITSGLTALTAQQLVEYAVKAGEKQHLTISAAIVDSGGHLLAFLRSDKAFIGSIEAAVDKARTAVYFRRETVVMQQGLEQGKISYLALKDVLPLEGGIPLYSKSTVIGALGISGATSAQDGELAHTAIAKQRLFGANHDK